MLTKIMKLKIKILRRIHENITRMEKRLSIYQNKKKKNAFLLKKRNKVFLRTKNLRKKIKNKKLNLIKVKAFFVKKMKKFKNYELNLLKNAKIHLMFNIFLLKSINSSTFIQKIFRYNI